MKIFFLDIDGTISLPGSPPSRRLTDAIARLQQQGDKVYICTGRSIGSLPDYIPDLHCDGYIYSAGGLVVAEGEELYRAYMPEDMRAEIMDMLNNLDVVYNLECEGMHFCRGDLLERMLKIVHSAKGLHSETLRFLSMLKTRTPVSEYDGRPVFKISFQMMGKAPADYIRAHQPKNTNLVFFTGILPGIQGGELSDIAVDKGKALKLVCAHYGCTTADAVAFGDSMNDAPMLLAAGEGVAMGNATEDVKALADRVCGSCREEGLAKALEEYSK